MKHLNYRLLACLLSFWTLLSALAQPVSALTLSERNDYAEYSATGDVTSEGPMPNDIIDVLLPTVRSDVFDVRLDPNNVLRQMGNNLKINGQTPRIGAGKVFFTNIDSDSGEISLTRNSDRYTIVNKGNVPLTVKMSVTVDKGNNEFTFAKEPDFTDAKGKAISGPALYLALTTGSNRTIDSVRMTTGSVRTPVLPIMTEDPVTGEETLSGYGATSIGWIAGNQDLFHIGSNDDKTQYRYNLNDGVSDGDYSSATFYMTGAMNTDGWDSSMGNFSLTVSWKVGSVENVTYEKGPDTDPSEKQDIRPWADTLFTAANASDAADLYVNYGSGQYRANAVSGITYVSAGGDNVTLSAKNANLTVNGSYVSVPATPAMYSGSQWALIMSGNVISRVEFSLKETGVVTPPSEDDDEDVSPGITVVNPATAQNEWADLKVTFGPMTKVTGLTYVTSNGSEATVPATTASVMQVNGDSVRVIAFKAAWTGTIWRLNLADDNGATATVRFDLKNQGTIEQPVVITTKKATAQNGVTVLKVYMNNMTEITGLRYRMDTKKYATTPHSATAIFPEVALPEVQVVAFKAAWNGDLPSLEFKDNSGNTFSARFDLK